MRSLSEDRGEFEGPKLKAWVGRKRQAEKIAASEATTWFADLEQGDDRALVMIGRSPADVLADARDYAESQGGYRLSTGRWMIDNNAGIEGEHSTYLVVYPRLDPYEEEVN